MAVARENILYREAQHYLVLCLHRKRWSRCITGVKQADMLVFLSSHREGEQNRSEEKSFSSRG